MNLVSYRVDALERRLEGVLQVGTDRSERVNHDVVCLGQYLLGNAATTRRPCPLFFDG